MRHFLSVVLFCSLVLVVAAAASAEECANPGKALGVSRTVTIDTKGGGTYGSFQYEGPSRGTDFLKDGEVILTFDDGPHPQYTQRILATLKKHCTKATFFSVGQMARAHKGVLKAVVAGGHTVGTHTWRHLNIERAPFLDSVEDIERGFAAVSLATDGHVAPFFRFPRLRETEKVRAYLAEQNIATFSVDVIAGDTQFHNPKTLVQRTLRLLKAKKKGILLFHDLKKATANALPTLLNELRRQGYKVVHIVPKNELNVDRLIAHNRTLEKKASEGWETEISLASAAALEEYFGPTWSKRSSYKKPSKDKVHKKASQADGQLPKWWPFN